MKAIFLMLSLLVFSLYSGQANRFYYMVEMKTKGTLPVADIVVLDISKDKHYFYSDEFLKVDSINIKNQKNSGEQKFAYPKFTPMVSWDKTNESFNFIYILGDYVYNFKEAIKLDWQLHPDIKEIKGYKVQKATTKYGGRDWEAWFCNDLPFAYGPYVFYGLPGLVLEVTDTENHYHFTFIGNKPLSEMIDLNTLLDKYYPFNERVEIKRKNFKKVRRNYYENPLWLYKESYREDRKEGVEVKKVRNGKRLSLEELVEEEKLIKKRINKYDNPIELDFKIKVKI